MKDDISIGDLINHSIANKLFLSKPWKDVEETYTPIDINLARKIIMNVNNQKFSKQSGWIFVLCSDEMRNDGTFLLSTCVAEKTNIRGIATYHGVIAHKDKSINDLLRQHFSAISPNTKVEAQMESFFEITPDMSLKFVNNQNPSIDHIDETSETVLYQKVEVGRTHVLCEDFWSQIQLLNMIKSDILNFKNNSCDGTFVDPTYNYGSSDMTFENLQVRTEVSFEFKINFNVSLGKSQQNFVRS